MGRPASSWSLIARGWGVGSPERTSGCGLGTRVSVDRVPDVVEFLAEPPGRNAPETVARRQVQFVLDAAGVFEVDRPGLGREVRDARVRIAPHLCLPPYGPVHRL